jgi:transposase
MAVEGGTTSRVFETYIERVLAPALRPGQVVVMDKLGAHRPERNKGVHRGRRMRACYLPSYSPDLDPIEEAFAKVKYILREIGARALRGASSRRWDERWEP